MSRTMTLEQMKRQNLSKNPEKIYSLEPQKKLRKELEILQDSNDIVSINPKRQIPYDEIQAIALTAVSSLRQVRDRCISAEVKNEIFKELLDEATLAIESRDLIINKYEPKEIDNSLITELDELQGFMTEDIRFKDIVQRKRGEMKRKENEVLRSNYNFTIRT